MYTGDTARAVNRRRGMAFKKVRPGLYERTGTPRQVKITREFAETVRRDAQSTLLREIVEDAAREDTGRRSEPNLDKASHRP